MAVTRPTNFAVGAADGIVLEPQAVNVSEIAATSAGSTALIIGVESHSQVGVGASEVQEFQEFTMRSPVPEPAKTSSCVRDIVSACSDRWCFPNGPRTSCSKPRRGVSAEKSSMDPHGSRVAWRPRAMPRQT